MALEAKTKKIIIWSLVALAAIALAFLAYNYFKTPEVAPPTPGGTTTTEKPGILDSATKIWCQAFPNSKVCGGKGKQDPCEGVACDPNRSGWDLYGFPNNCCS